MNEVYIFKDKRDWLKHNVYEMWNPLEWTFPKTDVKQKNQEALDFMSTKSLLPKYSSIFFTSHNKFISVVKLTCVGGWFSVTVDHKLYSKSI